MKRNTPAIATLLVVCAVFSGVFAESGEGSRRYLQCRSGEIQLLPALSPDEMHKGHKENLEALGGFVFVYESRSPFDIPLPDELRAKCRRAFDSGIDCILKTQIRQGGTLALWCQQHDRQTLKPCTGRAFELPSVCTLESADIVMLLMDIDETQYPEAKAVRIREAIEGAVAWYGAHALSGYKIEDGYRRGDGIVTSRLVRVPEDESKPLWCRYYTLDDSRPFTGRRDGTANFDFSELERGENISYKWFSDVGLHVESAYQAWRMREKERLMRAELRRSAKVTEWRGGKGSGGVRDVLPDRDTWENPENWSNGSPQAEDTVVFRKDATIWSMSSEPYKCARLVLGGKARLTLQSHYEANDAVNPSLRPSSIEGEGTIALNRFGLETREDEKLTVPEKIAVEANAREGAGSWIGTTVRGKMNVLGAVSCPGNLLRIRGDVTPEGWNDWTTDFGKRVWRSTEYSCRQDGERRRDAIVEVGGAKELRARLAAAGYSRITDIIRGGDDWRPLQRKE